MTLETREKQQSELVATYWNLHIDSVTYLKPVFNNVLTMQASEAERNNTALPTR